MTTIDACRKAYAEGNRKEYDRLKRTLPLLMFMCTFRPNTGAKGKNPEDAWRVQSAAVLNGLCMLDVDHVENPYDVFERMPGHMFEETCEQQVMLVHITPSGHGLRVVFRASERIGNLAQNQAAMALKLGVEADEACKDASRGSFCPYFADLLYLDENVFTFNNENYEKIYGEIYRCGGSAVAGSRRSSVESVELDGSPSEAVDGTAVRGDSGRGTSTGMDEGTKEELNDYEGIPYERLLDAWTSQNGGAPAAGKRHYVCIRMAENFRYIANNNQHQLLGVLGKCNWVREWKRGDAGPHEIEDICRDVCAKQLFWRLPKKLEAAIAAARAADQSEGGGDAPAVSTPAESFNRTFLGRLRPLLAPPYDSVVKLAGEDAALPAIAAAGSMFCTLLTRCWYRHFDGQPHRMNPQAYIIGDPASGKSVIDRLNTEIMAVMRAADEPGREAERRYKEEMKQKGANKEKPRQPEAVIRDLPARTSNAVFYRRMRNAKEMIDGEEVKLHLYTFDSELDSTITAQSGGSWIGKHDLELKAFHNEWSGVDYANGDSVNENMQVFWNTVTTGTPISLAKKINLRNVNDGLCSRIVICKMPENKYKMIDRGDYERNHDLELKLKEWGYKFERMKGELHIERLVDHVYHLCKEAAAEAEDTQDAVLDYLRKRSVFYAIWLTVPRIMARDAKDVTVTDDDLKFATLIYEAVIYWQDYYFGQMLQESWENANRNFVQRSQQRKSRNSELFEMLPAEFTTEEAQKLLGTTEEAVKKQLARWAERGWTERVTQGKYRKLKN